MSTVDPDGHVVSRIHQLARMTRTALIAEYLTHTTSGHQGQAIRWQHHPNWTRDQIIAAIRENEDPQPKDTPS